MGRKKREMPFNIGTTSVLFIFVILCLVSFSILSLSSATSDYNLSKRVSANTNDYYYACNKAEALIAETDIALKALYDTKISRSGYYESVGKKVSFAVAINELQSLNVELKILYPDTPGSPFYEITSWQVITTGTLEYDDSLNVFK